MARRGLPRLATGEAGGRELDLVRVLAAKVVVLGVSWGGGRLGASAHAIDRLSPASG